MVLDPQDLPSDHGLDLLLRELPPCTQMLRQASSGHMLINHVTESVLQDYDLHKETDILRWLTALTWHVLESL